MNPEQLGNPFFFDASVTLYPSDRSLAAFDNLCFLIYAVGDTLRNRIKYLSKVFMLTFTFFVPKTAKLCGVSALCVSRAELQLAHFDS